MKSVFSALLCAAVFLTPLHLDAKQAIRVRVTTPRAPVMSSTSDHAYIAFRLDAGDSVDVYDQTADGWLAIRPPTGTFSLVNANDVQLSETDSTGHIRSSNTRSWIGGYEDLVVSYESVISLKKGEPVRVLATRRMRVSPSAPQQTFVKISPPNGEFRWIHQRHVNLRGDTQAGLGNSSETTIVDAGQSSIPSAPDSGTVRPASYTTDMYGAPRKSFVPRWVKPGGVHSSSRSTGIRYPKNQIEPASASEHITYDSNVDATCYRLNKQLSAVVSLPPNRWELAPIRDELTSALQQQLTETQRLKVQAILSRVQKFQDIQRARIQLELDRIDTNVQPASHSVSSEMDVATSGFDRPIGTGVLNAEAASTNYDSKGWLVNVRSSRTDAPPYALVDNDGNVIVFVSPVPGLNLSHYVHKNIGVFGRRGYLHRLKTPHISVGRVVDLARHME